jgi:hypothetical protein
VKQVYASEYWRYGVPTAGDHTQNSELTEVQTKQEKKEYHLVVGFDELVEGTDIPFRDFGLA